jgi:hypothetical protein
MTVPDKPNDPPIADMTWAENGPSTYNSESEDPIKPTDQLVTGYGKQEPLPHAQFNWLFRSVMRWITWLVSKVDSHVHDGLGTDASAPKVNASQHLDWGTNGRVSVTTDTNSVHEITHGSTSGGATTKRIITGQLHAPTHVRTPTIQANGQGTTAAVNVRDTNGAHGFLDSAIVKSTNYLQTPTIRNTASGGTINVRDSNLGTTTLNVNTLSLSRITGTTSGAIIQFRDSGNNNNRSFIDAINVPIAIGRTNVNSNGFLVQQGFTNSIYSSIMDPEEEYPDIKYVISFPVKTGTITNDILIIATPIVTSTVLPCIRINDLSVSSGTASFTLRIHNVFDAISTSVNGIRPISASCSIAVYNYKE